MGKALSGIRLMRQAAYLYLHHKRLGYAPSVMGRGHCSCQELACIRRMTQEALLMARMTDYGKTCATCRYLGNAEYRLSVDGVETVKRQCLQTRKLPIWVRPDECCDKWESR